MWMVGVLATVTLFAHGAMAGEGRFAAPDVAYGKECGSCHVAYPAALLPAPAWMRVMSGLDKHFGTDASLDAGTRAHLEKYLQGAAGTGKRVRGADSLLRISETPWFLHEHGKVDPKKVAQCESCHTGAAQGDYSERGLRVAKERSR